MPRPYLVIDGYNLMHAAGLARRTYAAGQLARCRAQLLRFLAGHLEASERERTTIVFDATDAPLDLPRQMSFEEMTVRFAPPRQEADDTIEELVAGHSSPRQIRLVSSDHRLQKSVRRRRGSFVDSDDFFEELERRGLASSPDNAADDSAQPNKTQADEKNPQDARGHGGGPDGPRSGGADMDTESWLRIFTDIPGTAEFARDVESADTSIDQSDVAAMQDEVNRQPGDIVSRRHKGRRRRKDV